MKKEKDKIELEEKILNELKLSLKLIGGKLFRKLLNNNSDEDLYEALRQYNTEFMLEIEGEEENPSVRNGTFSFITLKDTIIDYRNISRVELYEEYDIKKNQQKYGINVVKKYPSPNEENFFIFFDSEEERDKYYDILIIKLNNCNINIL